MILEEAFYCPSGDCFRKIRLDRGLSQPEVERLFNVTADSVTGWELNRHELTDKIAKRIIQFQGYCTQAGTGPGKQQDYAGLIVR